MRGKRRGEVNRHRDLRIGEKDKRGAVVVVNKNRSEPTRLTEETEETKKTEETEETKKTEEMKEMEGRRSQEERGSKAKDWFWKEEVLWIPKKNSHGKEEERGDGGGRDVIVEREIRLERERGKNIFFK
ncbi:unnamed protein product [Cochlearia groenlandica]